MAVVNRWIAARSLPAEAGSHYDSFETRGFETRAGRMVCRARTRCVDAGAPVRAECQSTRRLGVEWIQLAARDGARLPASTQIVRLNVGAGGGELDRAPLPPSTLVAAIGLLIGDPLAQRFEETTEPGRKNPRRIA
jgi:hypothetical protein